MKNYLLYALFIIISFSACQQKTPSLQGKTIVVSAPQIYAERLKTALEKHQAKVTLMPAIETLIHDSIPPLGALTQEAARLEFDYIVLPSRNAIKAFNNEIRRQNSFQDWETKAYYTIGKDRDLLTSLGYKTSIRLVEPSLKGITKTIAQEGHYKNKNMLLIAPCVINMQEPDIIPDFINDTRKMGIHCHRIDGYTTQGITNKENKKIIKDLQQGKYDMLALTSGGECFAISNQINPQSIKSNIACFGPYTAKSATDAGFNVNIISQKYSSFDDFAETIVLYFNKKHP